MKTVRVSEKSWHYRLYQFYNDPFPDGGAAYRKVSKPKGVCGYFWTLVLITLFSPAIVGGAVVIAAVILPIAAVVWVGETIGAWRARRRSERSLFPPKPPSLLASYVRAKKARVCPRVEVVP